MSAGITYKRDIGRRLRALRHDADRSIRTVANFLSIPESNLGAYERGESAIPLRESALLARFYNVTIDHLAFGTPLDRELKTKSDNLIGKSYRVKPRR